MHIKYEPSICPRSPWVPCSSSVYSAHLVLGRSQVWILSGTQNFFHPMLLTCWLIDFHICLTNLQSYHLSYFHHTVRHRHCWSLQFAGRVSNMNVGYGLALHEFSEAQVDRAATRCLGGHRFKSRRGLVICSLIHFHSCFTKLKIYHLSFFQQW